MKKVLVFGMTSNPGGVESVIMNYYRGINRNLIQFDFLCNYPVVAYEDEIKNLGGNLFKITSRGSNYKKYKKELTSFFEVNSKKYDAIWVNICSLVNIDYLKFAKKYGIKRRIIHCHNSENDAGLIKKIIHYYNRIFIEKYATDFWACSEDALPWFYNKKILNTKQYKIIYNAIDVEKFRRNTIIRNLYRKELNIQSKQVVIGHVGRFHFQKNQKFLVDVFNELIKRNNNYLLLLIGQGELEVEIKKYVQNLGIERNVLFLGAKLNVEDYYQVMDLFVLPSVFEGLGIVAIEAQACSLPCLFSDKVPKMVKVNENVNFLSLDLDYSIWADKIEKMLKANVTGCNNLVSTSNYNINVQVKNFERLILEDDN